MRQITLGKFKQERDYRLRRPIDLRISRYRGQVLLEDRIFREYGAGRSVESAMLDYERRLVNYFKLLEHNRYEATSTHRLYTLLCHYVAKTKSPVRA